MALQARNNVKPLRVLGVDPAVAGATGYGIVEFTGSSPRLLRFGALKLPARASFASRLRDIHGLISQLVAEYAPDAVAVESVFSALSYSPREVKASVVGYGAASKQQMQQMVGSLLGLSENPEPADAADALAVALCHAHLSQARERMAAATGMAHNTPDLSSRKRSARIQGWR